MNVNELNGFELGELAANHNITVEEVKQQFKDTHFVKEDFFCNL